MFVDKQQILQQSQIPKRKHKQIDNIYGRNTLTRIYGVNLRGTTS